MRGGVQELYLQDFRGVRSIPVTHPNQQLAFNKLVS